MEDSEAVKLLSSLASPVRLAIFRRLVAAGVHGRVAGELAQDVGQTPANLSFHLRDLTHAGLLSVEQEGRFQRYRVVIDLMQALLRHLSEHCCGGQPQQCWPGFGSPSSRIASMQVLFLCTGNSCRSILAEAVFNHLAPPGWHAMSAGSHPLGQVHPRALALLEREGIATAGLHSKSWDELPPPDLLVTVCARAAGEACPVYLGQALRVHWGVEDPAQVEGDTAQIEAAFQHAYTVLRRRIEAFLEQARSGSVDIAAWRALGDLT